MEFPNESAELTPAYAAFKNLMSVLDGATFVENFAVGGIQMYLFDKDGQSLAVMWNEGGPTSIPVSWGEGLKVSDIFGNDITPPGEGAETRIAGLTTRRGSSRA